MAGRWFTPGTPIPFTNETDSHGITDILLKAALNTITLTLSITVFEMKGSSRYTSAETDLQTENKRTHVLITRIVSVTGTITQI